MKKALLIFLLLLSTSYHSLNMTDCEICKIINTKGLKCSKEDVAIFAEKNKINVEWICTGGHEGLISDPMIGAELQINYIGFENYNITISTEECNIVIFPELKEEGVWDWFVDLNNTENGTIKFGLNISASSKAVQRMNVEYKIYSSCPLTSSKTSLSNEHNTNVSYKDVWIDFSDLLGEIVEVKQTNYGFIVKTSFITTRDGKHTQDPAIGGGGGLGCIASCPPDDWMTLYLYALGEDGVELGQTFTYMRLEFDDRRDRCLVSNCIGDWQRSISGGAYSLIPQTSFIYLDCNGDLCYQKYMNVGVYYYRYPRCRSVCSGNVRGQIEGTSYTSGPDSFSCINTPPTANITAPEDGANITAYPEQNVTVACTGTDTLHMNGGNIKIYSNRTGTMQQEGSTQSCGLSPCNIIRDINVSDYLNGPLNISCKVTDSYGAYTYDYVQVNINITRPWIPYWFDDEPYYYDTSTNLCFLINESLVNDSHGHVECDSCLCSFSNNALCDEDGLCSFILTLNSTGVWNITMYAVNDTLNESNSTSFTIYCPPEKPVSHSCMCFDVIYLEMQQNTTYFDIGDDVLIWATPSNITLADEIWLFSADGTSQNMTYTPVTQRFYTWYTVKQSQELIMAISYSSDGTPSAIGELLLTYNPDPVTPSQIERMWTEIGYYGAFIFMVLFAVISILIAGFIIWGLLNRRKPKKFKKKFAGGLDKPPEMR